MVRTDFKYKPNTSQVIDIQASFIMSSFDINSLRKPNVNSL